jgi:hypothetical protein
MAIDTIGAFSFTVQDELGIKSACRIPVALDSTKTLANVLAAAILYGTALDATMGGQIVAFRIEVNGLGDEAWKDTPAAGSRVEQTGLLNFRNGETAYKWGLDIPSIANSVLDAGRIILGSGAVDDLVTLLLAGVSGDGVETTNAASQVLTALSDALLTFRKHRRALDRRTFETP